jgi:hypothetical protein
VGLEPKWNLENMTDDILKIIAKKHSKGLMRVILNNAFTGKQNQQKYVRRRYKLRQTIILKAIYIMAYWFMSQNFSNKNHNLISDYDLLSFINKLRCMFHEKQKDLYEVL